MKTYLVTERTNLFEPNVSVQFLIKIGGAPEVEKVIRAVQAAFAANEAACSKIVLEQGTAFYEKMEESGCRVTVVKKDWRKVLSEQEKLLFDLAHGELVRVFVIPSGQEVFLLIAAHHLAGDGKSMVYFLEDVMHALSGKRLANKPLYGITGDFFTKESRLLPGVRLYADAWNRKWKRSGRFFTWEDYERVHQSYWKEHDSQIVMEAFSQEELEGIRRFARKAGVSVNSCIVTAFLEACGGRITCGIPVNVRKDSNRSMSNQVSGIAVKTVYSNRKSWAENARNVHRQIQKKLNSPRSKYFVLQWIAALEPSLVDSVLLNTHGLYQNPVSEKFAKVMGYQGGKTRELGITNLTKLDIPTEYGQYTIESLLFIPPVVSYARRIIGVSTLENQMTVVYHFMSCPKEAEEQKLFRRGIQNLKGLCETI